MVVRRLILSGAVWAAAAACALPAAAQPYPNRPIKLVVPFVPGGAVDMYARAVQPALSDKLGQPVVIENRAGASGILGTDAVAKAAPDGYTLLVGNIGTLALNAATYKKLPYDPTTDFTPVMKSAIVNFALAVHPGVPVRTVGELVAYAKANPGKLSYGSSGAGGSEQLAAEQFKMRTGIDLQHVPYKGTGAAISDLIAGHIQLIFTVQGSVLPHAKSGKLRVLAVGGAQRSPDVPELPTIAEAANIPGYEAISWQGIAGPRGLPADVVERLNDALRQAHADPATRERLQAAGLTPTVSTPAEFGAYVKSEVGKWSKLAREIGISLEQ